MTAAYKDPSSEAIATKLRMAAGPPIYWKLLDALNDLNVLTPGNKSVKSALNQRFTSKTNAAVLSYSMHFRAIASGLVLFTKTTNQGCPNRPGSSTEVLADIMSQEERSTVIT